MAEFPGHEPPGAQGGTASQVPCSEPGSFRASSEVRRGADGNPVLRPGSDPVYTPRDLAEQTLGGTLPYEETWHENAANVLALINEIERTRGERFDTSDVKTRDLGRLAVEGLTVMRDDDEDSWELPDLPTINRAIQAVSALVRHAEDRQRFKRALTRIGKEWTSANASPDAIRKYARSVIAGGSARVPLAETKETDVAA